jgi:hypothetical protein
MEIYGIALATQGSNPLGSRLRLLASGSERLRLAGQTKSIEVKEAKSARHSLPESPTTGRRRAISITHRESAEEKTKHPQISQITQISYWTSFWIFQRANTLIIAGDLPHWKPESLTGNPTFTDPSCLGSRPKRSL